LLYYGEGSLATPSPPGVVTGNNG